MLFILNSRQVTVGVASNSNPDALPYFDDIHLENLDGVNTYEFSVPSEHPDSSLLETEGHVIVRNLDGEHILYTIKEINEGNTEGKKIKSVYCEDTAISELLSDVQRPATLPNATLSYALGVVLSNTSEWSLFDVPETDSLDVEFSDYITVLEALRQLAQLYFKELYFTVELRGTQIVGKRINFVEQRGNVTNVRFDYTHDLTGVGRIENSENIVTALIGVGKGDTDGNRITLMSQPAFREGDFYKDAGADWVGSESALQRWGKNGRHRFGIYLDDKADTPQELQRRTISELEERMKPHVSYSSSILNLERLTGYEAKKVRLGDTIMVVDKSYNPPIVINARVRELQRSYTRNNADKVDLGSYRPVTLSPDKAIQDLQKVISRSEVKWNNPSIEIPEFDIDVQVGARNLVLKSNEPQSSTAYKVAEYTLAEDWIVGQEYTVTVKGTVNDGQYFGVWRDKSSARLGNMEYDAEKGLWTLTAVAPETAREEKNILSLYNRDSASATQAEVQWIKLEKGNVSTDWTPAFEDINNSIAEIDNRTSDVNLIQTVVYSPDFESIFSTKADVTDIADMATGEMLTGVKDEAIAYVDGRIDGDGGLNEKINAVTSELTKTANEINAKFTSSGGVNLIKNSIGYADMELWSGITSKMQSIQNEELEQLGFGSGFYAGKGFNGTSNCYINQTVNIKPNTKYSLSFWLKKTTDNLTAGHAKVEVYDINDKLIMAIGKDSGQGLTNGWELGVGQFETEFSQVKVQLTVGYNAEATFSGLMLNIGEDALQWQHADGEVYNTNIQMNLNGIKVINKATKGYTIMSPQEFSGYAEVVDEVTGQATMERVFTLNEDTTEVTKLSAEKEVNMQSIKMLHIDSTGAKGWAFVATE